MTHGVIAFIGMRFGVIMIIYLFRLIRSRISLCFKEGSIESTLASSINDIKLEPYNRVTFEQTRNHVIANVFAKTSRVEINYRANGKNYSFKYDLPITEKLRMPEQDITSFYPKKTIRWQRSKPVILQREPVGNIEKDVEDKTEYVLISIGYDPDNPLNNPNRPQFSANRTIYRNIILEDVGYYTITKDDLKNFPANVYLTVEIYRGNYTKEEFESKNFMLGSYTMISFITKNKASN